MTGGGLAWPRACEIPQSAGKSVSLTLHVRKKRGQLLPWSCISFPRGDDMLQGKNLLNLWDYSVGQMEESGHYSAEKAASDKSWIRNRIKEVG